VLYLLSSSRCLVVSFVFVRLRAIYGLRKKYTRSVHNKHAQIDL
jgi:hypothetical protein